MFGKKTFNFLEVKFRAASLLHRVFFAARKRLEARGLQPADTEAALKARG